jgi:hypothetical protein
MYQLICEGPCNPYVGVADALASQYMEHKHRNVPFQREEEMLMWQRRLVYTTHAMVSHDRAQCLTCQATRRYGR